MYAPGREVDTDFMATTTARRVGAGIRKFTARSGATVWMAGILIASAWSLLRNLGHRELSSWDESCHAIVARNLTKHPLTFTLYDTPWLPFDYRGWAANHIWLHKPPLALWEVWLSYSLLGVNTFALRLPSVISVTIAVWLTYRIASDLFDRPTGILAAFLQAFCPYLFATAQGYMFSDCIDTSLLLWVEVSCWLLLRGTRAGRARWFALSGVAMGLAFLSKSYLALISLGIGLAIWLAARMRCLDLEAGRIRRRDLGLKMLAMILTIAPWVIYCLVVHPREFLWENGAILNHLGLDMEGWGSTWDRPLFDYLIYYFPRIYVALLFSILFLLVVLARRRKLPEFFILAWTIGAIFPHLFAHSKVPPATITAIPPMAMCFAVFIRRALRRDDRVYTAGWLASMLAITLVPGGNTSVPMHEFDVGDRFAPFVEANAWVIYQLAATVGIFAILLPVIHAMRSPAWRTWFCHGLRAGALVLSFAYAWAHVASAIAVTNRNHDSPVYATIGERIKGELPENACLFLHLPPKEISSHLELMYHADRSTYRVDDKSWPKLVRDAWQARKAGAIPYLITLDGMTYGLPVVMRGTVALGKGEMRTYQVLELAVDR